MKYPLILYLAHFIGTCSYSRIVSKKLFLTGGMIALLYLLFSVFIYWTIVMESQAIPPFSKLTVWIRNITATYFVLKGLFCDEELSKLLDDAFTYLNSYSVKSWSLEMLFACLSYVVLLSPELALFPFDNVLFSVYNITYEFLHRVIPLSTVMMFCICSVSVEAAYSKLQEDIQQISSQVSVQYIAKLRLKQLNVVNFVDKTNARFGLSILIYITHIQLSLLGRAQNLTTLVLMKLHFLTVCIGTAFAGTLLLVWYPLMKAGKACRKVRPKKECK